MPKISKGQWRRHPDHEDFAVKITEEGDSDQLVTGDGWDASGRFHKGIKWWLARTYLVADPSEIKELESKLNLYING